MKIAILGAGNLGGTLGQALEKAGHTIFYAVRNPDAPKYAPLLTQGAQALEVPAAIEAAEAVILATPWNHTEEALTSIKDFGNKPLLDATNAIGPGFQLTHGHQDSGGEQVARWAQNARVAKSI